MALHSACYLLAAGVAWGQLSCVADRIVDGSVPQLQAHQEGLRDFLAVQRSALDHMRSRNAALRLALERARAELDAHDLPLRWFHVDDAGDVVLSGINLQFAARDGWPLAAPDTGNLIVGYNERALLGTCRGGSRDGERCGLDGATDCPDGYCGEALQIFNRNGAENVVVGPQHDFPHPNCLTVGKGNSTLQPRSSAVGHYLTGGVVTETLTHE